MSDLSSIELPSPPVLPKNQAHDTTLYPQIDDIFYSEGDMDPPMTNLAPFVLALTTLNTTLGGAARHLEVARSQSRKKPRIFGSQCWL